ncbi:MAG: hypothetical protein MJZ67_08360 [Bacteroidales bacterium]|nr:hypothetical protein [Bacteroidales bacterium]
MKKHFFIMAMAFVALCGAFAACEKEGTGDNPGENPADTLDHNEQPASDFIGIYELDMVYDSITTSDGTWFDEEFFETMTGKINPPEHGYLAITQGDNDKLVVTATFVKDEGEKVFFTTTASEADGMLTLDDCTSDYYYASIEDMIRFTFHGFQNNMPTIYFKSIYTINLGLDYSYLTAYTCTKVYCIGH